MPYACLTNVNPSHNYYACTCTAEKLQCTTATLHYAMLTFEKFINILCRVITHLLNCGYIISINISIVVVMMLLVEQLHSSVVLV